MNIDDALSRAQDYQQRGELESAAEVYRAILAVEPAHADSIYGLGTVYLQQGRATDAIEPLERAAALMPQVPEFAFNLGLAEQQLGRPQSAATLQKAALLAAADVDLLAQILGAMMRLGCHRELIAVVARTGTRDPSLVALDAQARMQLGDWAGAAAGLDAVAAARPRDAAVHRELATARAHLRDFGGALEAYERFLSLAGEDAGNQLAYADLLLMARRPAEAAEAVERSLTLGADNADAELIAARCARLDGDYPSARERLRRAVAARPRFGNAWWLLLELEEDGEALEAIAERCHQLARDPAAGGREAILLALSAGNARDRLGEYDVAFEDLRFGNERQRALLAEADAAYDPAATEAAFGRLMAVFSKPLAERDPVPVSGPIFVLGMPRSGTTVVERMLASLEGVEAGGENEAMEFVASRYLWELDRGRLPAPEALTADQRNDLVAEYWRRTGGEPRILTDKLPHNFRHVGLIARLFPQAPIIYLERDPRDVALSIYSRPFPDGHAYACDLAALGHFYGQSQRLHDHWRQVFPQRILDVSYESLVADPEPVTRRIAGFCGLRWDPGCLEFHTRAEASFTFSELQVRQALNDRGVGRWRCYQHHLAPFVRSLDRASR